jgi:hypothetical protein
VSYTATGSQVFENPGHTFVDIVGSTVSYTTRFTVKSVSFKYLTNRQPDPEADGLFAHQSTPYLGVENFVRFITGWGVAAAGANLSQSLVFENDLTNLQVNPLGNGWYDVTEEYTTQALINSTFR